MSNSENETDNQSPNAERWRKIKGIFDVASELEPNEREEYLEKICGNDKALRGEIEKLVESFESGEFYGKTSRRRSRQYV